MLNIQQTKKNMVDLNVFFLNNLFIVVYFRVFLWNFVFDDENNLNDIPTVRRDIPGERNWYITHNQAPTTDTRESTNLTSFFEFLDTRLV